MNNFTNDMMSLRIDDESMDITANKQIEAEKALVEGLIRDDYPSVVLIGAQPKLGKTHFALDLCTEIARGGSFLGYQCHQGKVLYINLDSSKNEIARRVQNLAKVKGMTEAEMRNFSHCTLNALPISTLASVLIRDKAEAGLKLVVIDALCDTFFTPDFGACDENNAGHAMIYMNDIKRISEALRCPVAVIHHFRKSSEGGYSSDLLDCFRGSSGFIAAADTIIALSETNLNTATRENILSETGETGAFLKGVLVTARERSFEDPEPFKAWLQDGIFHRDSGQFVKGTPGRKPITDTDKEAFIQAFNALEQGGRVKVSQMAEALGINAKTVKTRADDYGYIRPDKGYINRAEA